MNEQQTKEPTKNRKENEMKRKNDPRHFHFIRNIFFLSPSLLLFIQKLLIQNQLNAETTMKTS